MADIEAKLSNHLSILKGLYLKFEEKVDIELRKSDNLVSINEIEHHYGKLINDIDKERGIWINNLLKSINEQPLISKTRKKYKIDNISLKTNRRAPISIQTLNQKLTINRYLLSPSTKTDSQNLMAQDGVKNIIPVDISLGIANLPHKMTVGAMLKVAEVAQDSRSFIHATSRLQNDFGIKLDPKTVMNVTNHIGEISFQNEVNRANEIYSQLLQGKLTFPDKKKEGILYIQVDGAMVNTREVDKKTDSGYKENKLGIVYNSNNVRVSGKRTQHGVEVDRHQILEKDHTSYIGSVEMFQILLFACAIRNGYGEYERTVLISDGATWIRNMKENLFCDAQQILDFYHLCEHVWNFGKLYFNQVVPDYTKWAKATCELLKRSEHKLVVKDVIIKENEKNITKDKLSDYIFNNRMNIDYAKYIEDGLDIGSGSIESANKIVLQYRLKQSGMRWKLTRAQNMVSLKAKMESGKWFSDVVEPVKKIYKVKII
jgi:hypothetical protein